MAEIYDFEERLNTVRKIVQEADAAAWAEASRAAEYFSRAVDALQVEFRPEDTTSKANAFYYSLLRKYYLDAAEEIEEFCNDDDAAG